MTDFSAFMHLQGIAPGNSWLGGMREWGGGHVFEGLQNYIENKNEENGNKMLGDFNCTIDKMERDGRNKTLYRCRCNYSLSNLIAITDWRIFGEGRTQIPLTSSTTIDLLAQDLDRVYTDMKIASNTKIPIILMRFLLTDSSQKLKLEKIHGTLILFYVSLSSP